MAAISQQDIINAQLNAKIEIVDAKFNQFMEEMRDFKDEMRQQNQMRSDEVKEIRQSLDAMRKHVRNLSITAMAGIGAMFVTSAIGIAAVIRSVINK